MTTFREGACATRENLSAWLTHDQCLKYAREQWQTFFIHGYGEEDDGEEDDGEAEGGEAEGEGGDHGEVEGEGGGEEEEVGQPLGPPTLAPVLLALSQSPPLIQAVEAGEGGETPLGDGEDEPEEHEAGHGKPVRARVRCSLFALGDPTPTSTTPGAAG